MKSLIVVLGALAVCACAGFLLAPEQAAPEARFATLAGERFATSDLRGKVTVIHFWATWCPDCVKETAAIVQAHRKFSARGYETVAVAVRDQRDSVEKFAVARALPYRVVLDDDGSISREFGNVRITPTTFVMDRQGRVLRRYVGEPRWEEFDRLVEKALGEAAR
jgi:peroxiredoxin